MTIFGEIVPQEAIDACEKAMCQVAFSTHEVAVAASLAGVQHHYECARRLMEKARRAGRVRRVPCTFTWKAVDAPFTP